MATSQRAESSKTLAAPSPTFANEPRSSATEMITVYAATCPIAREKRLDKSPAMRNRQKGSWASNPLTGYELLPSTLRGSFVT